jgi:D-glycero-D-manno-heptose 1,7-bisphosphate phosphatase
MGASGLTPRRGSASAWDIVFLDRDGTINVKVDGYVSDPDSLELLPGAAKAFARLNDSGCRVVIVTNQRGLATGALSWEQWRSVMSRLRELLAAEGAHVDDVELCPHEDGACTCRKPAPGLFLRALDAAPWARPERCAMVGDMPSDVIPARGLGMHTLLIGHDATALTDAVDTLLAGPAPG